MKIKVRNKKGFTMVEILAMLSIIAILFIMLVPKVSSSLEKSKESGVKSDFNSYTLAATETIMEEKGISEEEINKNLDNILKFENGVSKKDSPFNEKYYLFITNEGYKIVTKKGDKEYVLKIDEEGEVLSTFEGLNETFGEEIVSRPNEEEGQKEEEKENIQMQEGTENDFKYYVSGTNEVLFQDTKEK